MTVPGHVANVISASLILRLSKLIPGTAFGTAESLATDYNVTADDIAPILANLVTLHWLASPDGQYYAGRRAGSEWRYTSAFVAAMERPTTLRTGWEVGD